MEIVRSLGEGAFGSVDLVRFKEKDGTFTQYAMKSSKRWAYPNLAKELRVLSDLRGCPGVIQCGSDSLIRTCDSNRERMYSMLMEYAEGGTLESFTEGKILADHKIQQFAKMILHGLQSIHEKGYIHCDLKPENILIFNRIIEDDRFVKLVHEVKIADFGLATEPNEKYRDGWSHSHPFIGTPLYMSPESVKTGLVGSFLDIWSFGCIILQMYTGKCPWHDKTLEEIRIALSNGITPDIPEHLPLLAKDFLKMCFALNPEHRFTASELLSHAFLQGYMFEPERCMADSIELAKETKKRKRKHKSPAKKNVLRIKITPLKPLIPELRITPPKPLIRKLIITLPKPNIPKLKIKQRGARV